MRSTYGKGSRAGSALAALDDRVLWFRGLPRPTHRMVRLTEVECEKLLFLPVIVNGYVPVRALQFTEMVSFEVPGAVAGFRLKLALVLCGNPLTLRLTELEPPLALSETVEAPFEPRFAVIDDAEMPKSTAGAETTTVRVVE